VSRWRLVAVPLVVFLALAASARAAQAQPSYADSEMNAIAGDLMCECGAAVTVADCGNSTIANGMRDIIRQQVALGKSKGEILDHFATLYGECILAEPRKSGIGLVAWLGPLVAIVAGGAVLGGFMWVWASRRGRRSEPPPSAHGDLDEYERRVEEELKKFE
jgi:cytochrome c-type biogenesis protein CcmH